MAIVGTGLTAVGLKADFFKRLESLKPLYGELSTRIPSNTKTEQYAFLGSVPPMRATTKRRAVIPPRCARSGSWWNPTGETCPLGHRRSRQTPPRVLRRIW